MKLKFIILVKSEINLKETINFKLNDFLTLCKSHEVKEIYDFGSAISADFDKN